MTTTPAPAPDAPGAGLTLAGLRKSYGGRTVLDGVDLAVAPGEIHGFVGANGAGKTTAMRIALGVLAADAGRAYLDGAAIDEALRRRIGYMPEERGLYPRESVAGQLTYFARLHGVPAARAREQVAGLLELLGLADRAGDAVQTLSLGNQQRVQLAAALVHDPAALVLDEPFSGLDPVAVTVMSAALRRRAAAGVPVLFSSHQLELVERLCDRVSILAGGRIAVSGAVAELRARGPRRLALDCPGVDAAWAAARPGVAAAEADPTAPSRLLLTMSRAADEAAEQGLLAAALARGPVREFAPVTVPLTELYQEVVRS